MCGCVYGVVGYIMLFASVEWWVYDVLCGESAWRVVSDVMWCGVVFEVRFDTYNEVEGVVCEGIAFYCTILWIKE